MTSSCDEPIEGISNWELEESPRGQKAWLADATLSDRTARDFWKKFWIVATDQVAPWEYVCVSIWLDSGRVIAYPALHGVSKRIDEVMCQVKMEDVIAEWDGLPDAEEDEELFVREAEALEQRIVSIFAAEVTSNAKPVRFFSADGDLLLERP
jgi:hypothetical protein